MKSRYKKGVIITTALSMLFGVAITSHASGYEKLQNQTAVSVSKDNIDEAQLSSAEVIECLNNVDFGKDISFTELPVDDKSEYIKFDSVEEAENYIKQFIEERKEYEQTLKSGYMLEKRNGKLAKAKVKNGWKEGTVNWWGGGNTSLLSTTNAMIRHYYKNGNISKITVKDSYMTGVVGATWTHRSGKGKALGGTSIQVSVTGTWFIGMDIKGFPLGASFDETLESPTLNVNVS